MSRILSKTIYVVPERKALIMTNYYNSNAYYWYILQIIVELIAEDRLSYFTGKDGDNK